MNSDYRNHVCPAFCTEPICLVSLFDTVLYLWRFFKSQPPYQLFIRINSFNGFSSHGVTLFHGRIIVFVELTSFSFTKDDESFKLALCNLANASDCSYRFISKNKLIRQVTNSVRRKKFDFSL